MRLRVVCSFILSAAIAMIAAPPDACAEKDKASVSIVSARKVALARVPGTIVNEKLKQKSKKHPQTWSIKIRPRGDAPDSERLTKVEVDADTGAILKVKEVKARKPQDD
jgi:uncharacterized membrane protein YkoI